MGATKLPSFQFYPGDWMKDPALRSCTIAARGLWTDMLCLMFESNRRGYLQHATGKPVTAEQLARMTGCSTDDVSHLLQELEDSGVFSRTEHGVVYSRRMARDEGKREKCRVAGKRGGNPALVDATLKGGFKGEVKGDNKGRSKGGLTPSSSSSTSTSIQDQTPSESGGVPPPAATAKPPPDRKTPDSPHHRAIAAFCEAWKVRYETKYPFNAGKDASAVQWMLAQVGGDEAKFAEIVKRFLADDDPFVAANKHDIGTLRAKFARWLVDQPEGHHGASNASRQGVGRTGRADARPGKYDDLDAPGATIARRSAGTDLFGSAGSAAEPGNDRTQPPNDVPEVGPR